MALGAVPILLGPNFKIAAQAQVPAETRRLARLMMLSDGLRAGSFHFTWLIALFITLGSSYVAFGGAMAIAGLAGALAGLGMGRAIDLGHARNAGGMIICDSRQHGSEPRAMAQQIRDRQTGGELPPEPRDPPTAEPPEWNTTQQCRNAEGNPEWNQIA